MGQLVELTGKKFNRWTVIERSPNKNNVVYWYCSCDCGNTGNVTSAALTKGKSLSCGCYQREVVAIMNKTHGMSKTKIYKVWAQMRRRCENKNDHFYEYYGGRGISVSNGWSESFENFYSDMGAGYKEGLTLERIDNDGPYSKDNCCWATREEQGQNRRDTVYLETPKGLMNAKEASDVYGIPRRKITRRYRSGKTIDQVLSVNHLNKKT